MPLSVGERVLAYGWVGCGYRDGVAGTIIRVWLSGLGEWVYSVVFDAPQPDGVCLVEAVGEDVVKAPPIEAPPRRAGRGRRSR